MTNTVSEKSNCQPWHLPNIMDEDFHSPQQKRPDDKNPVYQKGFHAGYAKAKEELTEQFQAEHDREQSEQAETKYELESKIQQINVILSALNAPFEQLVDKVEQECVALSCALAEKLYQKKMSEEPEQLLKIVKKACQQLPIASQALEMRCHPAELSVLQNSEGIMKIDRQLTLVGDEKCERGEFILKSDKSAIDGRLIKRCQSLLNLSDDHD